MIGVINFLASGAFSGGGIGDIFNTWADKGIFDYALPGLLIFALVFAILSRIKVFGENRGVNVLVAVVVALMALQFDFVSQFFSEVFPRLGVGIAVILVILIMIGLFIDPDKQGLMITLTVVGAIVAIVVLVTSAGSLGWSTGTWWSDNWENIAILVAVILLIGWVIAGGGSKGPKGPSTPWKALGFRSD